MCILEGVTIYNINNRIKYYTRIYENLILKKR